MSLLLNENGGSIVYDATGNQNHGTGTNIVWGEDGLDLPGSNEHIIEFHRSGGGLDDLYQLRSQS
jgi:hypothetical protein